MSMMLALLLCCTNPQPDITRETVHAIELNRFYSVNQVDEDWLEVKHVFDQFLFLNFIEPQNNHLTDAWRMRKNSERVTFNHGTGYYELWIRDGDLQRVIQSRSYREIETLWDVEIEHRELLAKEHRRELRGAITRKGQ